MVNAARLEFVRSNTEWISDQCATAFENKSHPEWLTVFYAQLQAYNHNYCMHIASCSL